MITTYGYSGSKIPRYPKIKIISDIGILTGSRKFRRGQFCRMTVLAKLSSGETIRGETAYGETVRSKTS